MKAIRKNEKFPKFLITNQECEKGSWNKYILFPWKNKEIVRVEDIALQIPNHKYDKNFKYVEPTTNSDFKKKYVRVIRKDKEGKWTIHQTGEWSYFEMLNKK